MNFIEAKKGQGFVWLFVLVMLFIVGSLFIILDRPLTSTVDKFRPTLEGTQFEGTANKINFVWDYFLVVVLLVLIIWGVTQSMRRNDAYF